MGEFHPAEKKVVVEFSPEDFGLTEVQQMKLRKLAGPRYNPEKETIKMSCESFEHQAQNKRYLAELVEKLITEAKVRDCSFNELIRSRKYAICYTSSTFQLHPLEARLVARSSPLR